MFFVFGGGGFPFFFCWCGRGRGWLGLFHWEAAA